MHKKYNKKNLSIWSINQTAYFCSLEGLGYCLFCIYPVFLDWSYPWNKNIRVAQFTLLFFKENRPSATFPGAEDSYLQGHHSRVHSTAIDYWMLNTQKVSVKQCDNKSTWDYFSGWKDSFIMVADLLFFFPTFKTNCDCSPGDKIVVCLWSTCTFRAGGHLVNLQQDLSGIVCLHSRVMWAAVLQPKKPIKDPSQADVQ